MITEAHRKTRTFPISKTQRTVVQQEDKISSSRSSKVQSGHPLTMKVPNVISEVAIRRHMLSVISILMGVVELVRFQVANKTFASTILGFTLESARRSRSSRCTAARIAGKPQRAVCGNNGAAYPLGTTSLSCCLPSPSCS